MGILYRSVTAPTSLNGRQPTFARCLAISCAGRPILYIHFRGLLPLTKFASCKIHFASKFSVLLYWQRYCTALEQWASAKVCDVVYTEWNYGTFAEGVAGRPSRLASAHILVVFYCVQRLPYFHFHYFCILYSCKSRLLCLYDASHPVVFSLAIAYFVLLLVNKSLKTKKVSFMNLRCCNCR